MKDFGRPGADSAAPAGASRRSAEQLIAIALVGVCIVAGAGVWLASRGDHGEAASGAAPSSSAVSGTAAAAPTHNWQGQLEGEVDKLDRARAQEQRAAQAAALEDAQRERERQELERRQRELAAQSAALAAQKAEAARAPAESPAPAAAPPSSAKTQVAAAAPVDDLLPARVLSNSCRPPEYPRAAERLQQEGQVILGYQIDEKGRVIGQRIDKSSGHELLDNAAILALGRCRFAPATRKGVPETSWTQVRFTWQLPR